MPASPAKGRVPTPWRSEGRARPPREGGARRRLGRPDGGLRPGTHGGAPRQDPGHLHRLRKGGDVDGDRAGRTRGPPGGPTDRSARERDLGRLRADDDRRNREIAQSGRAGGSAGDARRPGGVRVIREVAWRLFASEYNDANLEAEGTGERPPSYIVTPLGARVNRLFVVGVLTDVENVGTDGQPMWRGRVSDPTETFHVYAGEYQPEAAAKLAKVKPPAFAAIMGKSRTYSPEPGTTYTSVRPEMIKVVEEHVRDYWILEACRSLKERLEAAREAQKMDPLTKDAFVALGYPEDVADGVVAAAEHYGKVDLARYTSLLAEALRYLL